MDTTISKISAAFQNTSRLPCCRCDWTLAGPDYQLHTVMLINYQNLSVYCPSQLIPVNNNPKLLKQSKQVGHTNRRFSPRV